ncbi:MAG: hypothetical protein CMJ78_23020 [Planctomycetaceae bacterium]|nr:hypothetical protein [Planctomycetaceae bacterium]
MTQLARFAKHLAFFFLLALIVTAVAGRGLTAKDKVLSAEDTGESFELKTVQKLKYSGKLTYTVSLAVENKSDETQNGPIAVSLEKVTPSRLELDEADDEIDGNQIIVLLLADEQLKPRSTSKPVKVVFSVKRRLSARERRDFELKAKIVRLTLGEAPADEPKDEPSKQPSKTTQSGKKAAGGTGGGGGGNKSQQGDDDDPVKRQAIEKVTKAQDEFTKSFLPKKDVHGTATGLDDNGNPVIKVFIEKPGAGDVPKQYRGVVIETIVTGPLVPDWQQQDDEAGDPRRRFERPSPIGVSVGNLEKGCAAGTIACRVRDAEGVRYALSNNHVFAMTNKGRPGDRIAQPGRADSGCDRSDSNVIGELTEFVEIQLGGRNKVDAAIARIDPGQLGTSTPSNGYGDPANETRSAQLGLRVQKYGRSTGLTRGRVVGVNATVYVGFKKDSNTRFDDQVVVRGGGESKFITGGDSGSLLVSDPGRQPVGLLFAGSVGGTYGIANDINEVLKELKVQIDGGGAAFDPPAKNAKSGPRGRRAKGGVVTNK